MLDKATAVELRHAGPPEPRVIGHRSRAARLSILVTDGDQRSTLALVRALGRTGHRLYVCSVRGRSVAGASRYVAGEEEVPDPLTDTSGFIIAVERLVARWSIGVLIPVTDASIIAVLAAREHLRDVRIPFPGSDVFHRVSDKARIAETAAEIGICVPEQHVLVEPHERQSIDRESLPFPLAIKPTRSVSDGPGTRVKLGVSYARDRAELATVLDSMGPEAYPLLLQRRIAGEGRGMFLLLWDGKLVAAFSHRRIREKPPSGGVSVCCESVPLEPDMLRSSRELLDRCGWQGVAMVEYKRDAATGIDYLMEVNGRFWGSLQLAIDAGVDFPSLLVEAALGRDPAPVLTYQVGVRNHWWWGEVDHLWAQLRQSRRAGMRAKPEQRWRVVGDFLRSWRARDRYAILRLADPQPFVRETIDWFLRR